MRQGVRRLTALTAANGAGRLWGQRGTGPGGGGNGNGPITAKIDGQNFVAVSAFASRNQGFIVVGGGTAQQLAIGMAFPDAGPGTYDIGGQAITNADVVDGSSVWTASAAGGGGSIVVTALDQTHVAGTFSYSAVAGNIQPAQRVVTNGQFDVQF